MFFDIAQFSGVFRGTNFTFQHENGSWLFEERKELGLP